MESHTPVRGVNDLRTLLVDTVTADLMYICRAAPGASTADAVWQIQKLETVGGVMTVKWADGDAEFDNVCNNRASLTYE